MSLPGFNRDDTRKPPNRAELERRDNEMRAVELWYRTQSEDEVREAMGLPSVQAARVLINRGIKRYEETRADQISRVRYRQAQDLERMREGFIVNAWAGSREAAEMALKVRDAEAKLWGSDAQKEQADGPQVVVIDVRPPWERGEMVDGEVVEVEQIEEGE